MNEPTAERQHTERAEMDERHEHEREADDFTPYENLQIDLLTRIEETMSSLRFYLVGMFVGITGIGVSALAFLVWMVLRQAATQP